MTASEIWLESWIDGCGGMVLQSGPGSALSSNRSLDSLGHAVMLLTADEFDIDTSAMGPNQLNKNVPFSTQATEPQEVQRYW